MMRAISLWQPWASLIAVGAKRYETRGWKPPQDLIGQPLAIHAAKNRQGMRIARGHYQFGTLCDLLLGCGHGEWEDWETDLPFGAVIAVVRIVDAVATSSAAITDQERALGDWSDGRWGWKLELILRLDRPAPQQGRQRVFQVDWDVQAAIATEAQQKGVVL